MNRTLLAATAVAAALTATQAAAQITFYGGEGFRGRAFTTDRAVVDMERVGFNDRASSIVIDRGRWEVCEHDRFQGECVVLRRGNYESLGEFGMRDKISSVRPVGRQARQGVIEVPEPPPVPVYEYRVRPNERTFEVPVSSVRAVVGPPQQRCWVERQQVQERGDANIGGAVLGAVIGGVIGHQFGSGRGNDAATVGGALAGSAVGANSGRGGSGITVERDVQRCATAPSGPPQYWDVTYNFRGTEHRIQMQAPPGPTILVNGRGEPRG